MSLKKCLEALEDAVEWAKVEGNENKYLEAQSKARGALEDLKAFFETHPPDSDHDGHEEVGP